MVTRRSWIAIGSAGAVLSGCGSAAVHHADTICTPPARAAVARSFTVRERSVAATRSLGNNAMPQCAFSARLASGERVTVTANVDDAPSPYFRLERTEIEQSQVFTSTPLIPLPVAIKGLGLKADWFPEQDQLMTTDGYRLITVSFAWPGATRRQEQAVGEALARTYLRKLTAKQAERIANGFPSG